MRAYLKELIMWDITPRLLLVTCYMLIPYLAYCSTLKVEATAFSEMSIYLERTAWCYIPEDKTFRNQCRQNLKLQIFLPQL
jgi:hypothetical protein